MFDLQNFNIETLKNLANQHQKELIIVALVGAALLLVCIAKKQKVSLSEVANA